MSESESDLTLASESSKDDGSHIIVVTFDEEEVHRDVVFIDRSEERQRFTRDLVTKLPAISEDADVSPDDIDAQLIALASKGKSKVQRKASSKYQSVEPGTKVRANDRDNFGEVLADNGDNCTVHFVSPEGYEATKQLPKSQLRTLDGQRLKQSVAEAKPEPFPDDLLPSVIKNYIVEGAEARATDPSIVALPLFGTLAACIGLTRRIAPKKDWTAPAILWGAVVARSGSVKSAGYDLAFELLKPAEDKNHRDYLTEREEFRIVELEYRKIVSQWSKSKNNSRPPEPPKPPTAKRLVVDDQTVESLAPLLEENPRGLFLLSDELRGWFDGMGAYSASGRGGRDEARWLALFDGRSFNVDRKTNRERTYIPAAGVSVAGTIQPGTLARVVGDGQVESGLLARLLLVMPEPRAKKWTEAEMSETTRLAMQRVVDQLKTLEHEIVDGFPEPIILQLTDKAKQRFIRFVNSHGIETMQHGDALAAAWSKLEGYALRFALIIHLSRWASGEADCTAEGPVDLQSITAGIELSQWFANEAERVYERIGVTSDAPENGFDRHVERLVEWLLSKGGKATERDIARGLRRYRGKENSQHIDADCKALVEAGRAEWRNSRKTRSIVLIDLGDGDTSTGNHANHPNASPSQWESDTSNPATDSSLAGDTSATATAEHVQTSPSPLNSNERVKVTI